jgi:hypothetical protein
MSSSLTLQTDREIRYEQRCQKKKIEQQNLDRTIRFQNRETSRNENTIDMTELSNEVTTAISGIVQRNRFSPRHFRHCSSYTSLRY